MQGFRALAIEIVGHDRRGIVRDISHVLAGRGVNIDELETEVTSAAMSGEPTFPPALTCGCRTPRASMTFEPTWRQWPTT